MQLWSDAPPGRKPSCLASYTPLHRRTSTRARQSVREDMRVIMMIRKGAKDEDDGRATNRMRPMNSDMQLRW
jgi:hypothetical protein